MAHMVERLVALAQDASDIIASHPDGRGAPRAAVHGDGVVPGSKTRASVMGVTNCSTPSTRRSNATCSVTAVAIVGRTVIDGVVSLELTFVNPMTQPADVAALVDLIVAAVRLPATETTR